MNFLLKLYELILNFIKQIHADSKTEKKNESEFPVVIKPQKQQTTELITQAFGVGIIKGKKSIDDSVNENRPNYMSGTISFEGFKDSTINNMKFDAGSGGGSAYPSVPYGTYVLTSQGVGSVISDYYEYNGIDPNEGAFKTVYNVGRPDDITGTGYDPKVDRKRAQIQIHSNVRHDKSHLVSSGCLTVTPEDYPALVNTIQNAIKETIYHRVALVVEPNKNNTGSFKIKPIELAEGL